jgi:methylenetetrahydrofolate dehydrogenase (NADP+)/methenyltetrahydrofolate cyclohydrolase
MYLLGKPVAEKILSETKERIKASGIVPGLAVVLASDDPASRIYVGIKELRAREIGMLFELRTFEKTATESEITDCIHELNGRADIHGIIVQLPLPGGFHTDSIIGAIDPKKDADGFLTSELHTASTHGSEKRYDFVPIFPEAMIELAKSAGESLVGKTGIVLANSERFGSVMIDALAREGMKVEYILFSGLTAEKDNEKIQSTDVVFTALGRPELLRRDMFKKGAVVIDGGISKNDGKIVGDVSGEGGDADIFLSPVPGGVGPVTVACLLRRVVNLALEREKIA